MNFDLIVHSMLNSLMTSVLSLDIAINFCVLFLNEGLKVLFRFILATLSLNRGLILSLKTKKDILTILKNNSI